jgi:arylsulfate sulfotransferase
LHPPVRPPGAGRAASAERQPASLRAQDCIVKFDRESGRLRWLLGVPGNWRAPWANSLLEPDGPLEWQFHQHDCSITPSGTILCFDNGNHRAQPFQPPTRAAQSRAVEFAVDEGNGTVRQVWSYGERPSERRYAGFQGGALRLPRTGNTFITYGGLCSIDRRAASGPDRFEPGEAEARDRMAIRAQLLEVTPDRQVVLDVRIGGEAGDPQTLSVFRSEQVPA